MAIKRRTATVNKNQHSMRHPLLKHGSVPLRIYRYIQQKPGCMHKDFAFYSTSSQPVTNLLNAGLIRTEGDKKSSYRYYAVPENETGPGRDQLNIKIQLFMNKYGEYSIAASLDGQRLTAHEDHPAHVLDKNVRISVPSPREVLLKRDVSDVHTSDVNREETTQDDHVEVLPYTEPDAFIPQRDKESLIIEGDFDIIP